MDYMKGTQLGGWQEDEKLFFFKHRVMLIRECFTQTLIQYIVTIVCWRIQRNVL